MNRNIYCRLLVIAFAWSVSSCKSKSDSKAVTYDTDKIIVDSIADVISSIQKNDGPPASDSVEKMEPDDFPVTNNMLNYTDYIHHPDIWADGIWFKNDSVQAVLFFELEVDKLRAATFLFKENEIPPDMLQRMNIYNVGEPASMNIRSKYLPQFIQNAEKISATYFKTNDGFQLGDNRQKAFDLFGKPDSILKTNGYEIDDWYFVGDNSFDYAEGKINRHGKPLAINSFGFEVMMYFKNDILAGLIFFNEEP